MNNPSEEFKEPTLKEHKRNFKAYLLYAFALCLGLFAANIFFKFITRASERNIKALETKKTKSYAEKTEASPSLQANIAAITEVSKAGQPQTAAKKPVQYQELLVVNGIFISHGEKSYALVNNRIVKEGDTIKGLKLVRITIDGLELSDPEGLIIKLYTK
jgi:cytoskeletal protein RodZ